MGEDVEFAVLGQQLDLHALPGPLPGLVDEVLLQPRQAPLRGADQILHRLVAAAHLCQHRLGGNAAVHHPDAARLAVLRLDPGQEGAQRPAVGGVAGQDLAGERQAFGRHHQGDHHLRAVRPLVAAVAVAALVALGQVGGVDLEIEPAPAKAGVEVRS